MIGESEALTEFFDDLSKVAKLNRPVLIVGERGTGKELAAERAHYLSNRWDRTLIKLNCGALSETLLESELFGHEAGSFTGAQRKKIGRFELANKGSIVLDELANTSLRLQEKILRVVEYGEFERVGGENTLKVDVRIIASTNVDLPDLAKQGKFRNDLLDRLAFDVLTLPPLRERGEDILILANHFAVRMIRELKGELFLGFTEQAKNKLMSYPWPGNIREIKNVIERAIYKNQMQDKLKKIDEFQIIFNPFSSPFRPKVTEEIISQETLSREHKTSFDLEKGFTVLVENYKKSLIQQTLKETRFNKKRTAEKLQLTYNQLRGIMRKLEL